jgi:hypothetical protein
MRNHLVVANQTATSNQLVTEVRRRNAAGPAHFHLVVPATPVRHLLTWTEGEARALATERLEKSLAAFHEIGAMATGEVGDANPLAAVGDALLRHYIDEILVSTFPHGISRWLHQDLPHRIERAHHLPVTVIVTDPVST